MGMWKDVWQYRRIMRRSFWTGIWNAGYDIQRYVYGTCMYYLESSLKYSSNDKNIKMKIYLGTIRFLVLCNLIVASKRPNELDWWIITHTKFIFEFRMDYNVKTFQWEKQMELNKKRSTSTFVKRTNSDLLLKIRWKSSPTENWKTLEWCETHRPNTLTYFTASLCRHVCDSCDRID